MRQGQFGKNHVGDRNESLPTVNGFDEFFGNLIISTQRKSRNYPTIQRTRPYKAKFGPRGVLNARRPIGTTRRSIRAPARSASRPSKIPVR